MAICPQGFVSDIAAADVVVEQGSGKGLGENWRRRDGDGREDRWAL